VLKNVIFCLFITFGLFQTTNAQLVFTEAPTQGAFFAQNKATNTATVEIKGFVDNNIYTQLEINLLKNGVLEKTFTHALTYTGGKANFTQTLTLKTGKHFYTIKYELTGGGTYKQQVSEICVGDVYLVQGQSNAVAASFNAFDPKYSDRYIRSFGSSSNNPNTCLADSSWHDADPVFTNIAGSIGQWAGVMAKHLLDSFNTPICILNGAVGGTRIDQHQPIPWNHEHLYSIYGRLLYRVRKAELDSNISGIIYFQGESDGGNAVKHDTQFTNLYNAWVQDFPGFQKLYVIQVREGCGAPSLQLRDKQRLFEQKLPNCQTVSANGLNNHDGCHYGFTDGYEKLGMQMSKLVGRDFYWSAERENIDPPNIKSCYYSNGRQTEITLNLTNPDDIVNIDPNFEKLFKIEGDITVSISGGAVKNNQIVLTLNKNSCLITGLSYDGLRGNQPWVKNNIGFGLISFYNVPIKNHNIKEQLFFCKGQASTVGTPKLSEVKYELKQFSTGKIFASSQLNIALQKNDSFRLTMSFDSLTRVVKDTVIIYVNIDNVQVPNLGRDSNICLGQSLSYAPFKQNFYQFQWTINNIKNSNFSILVDSTAAIKLSAFSNAGCQYDDAVNVALRKPKIPLDSSYIVCKDSAISINLKDTFKAYYWNSLKGNASNIFYRGSHNVTVVDSFGCVALNHFEVLQYAQIPLPQITESICAEATVKITKPNNFTKWFTTNRELGDFLYLAGANNLLIYLEDSNSCQYQDTIKTQIITPLPYPTIIDTAVCIGSKFKLTMPANQKGYWINNNLINDSIVYIPFAAETLYKIKDNNGCYLSGLLKLKQTALPLVLQYNDTTICANDSLAVKLDNDNELYINNELITSNYYFKSNKAYKIKVINSYYCEAEKTIFIASKTCISSTSILTETNPVVYPNPFNNSLYVAFSDKLSETVYLYDLHGKLILTQQVQNQETIDVSKLPAGIYYLKTSGIVWKVLKE